MTKENTELRDAVLDAAEAYAVGGSDLSQLTSTRIAHLANVSVGWLYKHIGDKQSVIDAIVQRHLVAIQSIVRDVHVDISQDFWPDAITLAIDAIFNYARSNRGFMRLYYSQLADPRISSINFQFDQESAKYYDLSTLGLDRDRQNAIAAIMVGIIDKGLEISYRVDEFSSDLVREETKVAVIAYLRHQFTVKASDNSISLSGQS